MRIGFLQFAPVFGQPEATQRHLERLLQESNGVDLLVLPELTNSGYNFSSSDEAWQLSEEIPQGGFTQILISLCREKQCYVVCGINERDQGKLYNTAVLVGPEGYIGKYRKLHLFWNEFDYFAAGDLGLPVFDVGLGKIGILICFDWIFPEVWRILALQGADIICHPSNLVLPGFCQKAIPVHAMMNRFYVVTANRIGTEGNLTFTGTSTIADPKGNVLAQASATEEIVSIVEIDVALARDKMMTPRNDILKDRRPECYTLLTELKPYR